MVWPILSVAFTLCTAVALVAMTVKDKVPVPAFQRQRGHLVLDRDRVPLKLYALDDLMTIDDNISNQPMSSQSHVDHRQTPVSVWETSQIQSVLFFSPSSVYLAARTRRMKNGKLKPSEAIRDVQNLWALGMAPCAFSLVSWVWASCPCNLACLGTRVLPGWWFQTFFIFTSNLTNTQLGWKH